MRPTSSTPCPAAASTPASLAALLPVVPVGPLARATWTVRGSVGPTVRRYARPLAAAVNTARLTFPSGLRLRLTLTDRSGEVLARAVGRSPLQLRRRLGAGTYALTIGGAKRTTVYTLTVVGRRSVPATPLAARPH